MADATTDEAPPKKGLLIPLIIGVVLAVAGGAGAFLFLSGGAAPEKEKAPKEAAQNKAAFLPIPPLVISLGTGGVRHLRFEAQLEVRPGKEALVEEVLPRIVDILNSYLRAIDISEVEDPSALVRIRAQMLRRIQIVVGDDAVSDLLVMEFLLN